MNTRLLPAKKQLGYALLGALLCAPVACQRPARSVEGQPTPGPSGTSAPPAVDPHAPLRLQSALLSGDSYLFALGQCTGAAPAMQCVQSAQIWRDGKLVFSLPLPPAWSDRVVGVSPSTIPGIGDPLGEPRQWIAWTVGQAENQQSLAARVVRLDAQREGIVLRTVHDGAAHDALLLRRKDELSSLEIEGRWTAIAVRATNQPQEEIVLFAQVSGEAGFVWASALHWDASSETLTSAASADPPAFLVNTGQYPSYAAAETALTKSCLRNVVIAPTSAYQGLEPNRYFVGALSADQSLASAGLAIAQHCPNRAERQTVLPLRFRGTPLARMPLGAANQSAEVSVGRYNGSGWPLLVSRTTAKPGAAKLEVSWPVSSPIGHPASDVDLPIGDPLEPRRGAGGFSLGADEATSLLALSTVRLSDEQRALLVSQEAGFEHRKRRHDLVVSDSAGTRVAWSAVDPPGPAWSNVVIRAKDEHTDEVLLISSFDSSQAGEADRLEVSRLVWDAKKGELVNAALGCDGGVYLAISRAFPSLERAIAAKSEPCAGAAAESVPSELVLPAPPRSGVKGYVLAQVSTEQSLSRLALTASARCWPSAKAVLAKWCPVSKK